MFRYVQQVEYNVRNRDEMVAYMDRVFGMKPDSLVEDLRQTWQEAQYRVGETLLRIREPLSVDDGKYGEGHWNNAEFLEENGPGVHIVSWGITDNIADVARKLRANGNTLRGPRGFHQSSQGTDQLDIDPKDSLGVLFQLTERPREDPSFWSWPLAKSESGDLARKQRGMLKFVYYVYYLIRNRDEIVAYIERNFGMKPDRLLEDQDGQWKEVQYRVGPTWLKMIEHAPGTKHAKSVEEHGPSIHHVVWGVDNIADTARQLKAKGVPLLAPNERGFCYGSDSPHGTYEIHIDPQDAFGIDFRMAHAPHSLSIEIARVLE